LNILILFITGGCPRVIRQGVHSVRLPSLVLKVQDYSIEIALDRRDFFTQS